MALTRLRTGEDVDSAVARTAMMNLLLLQEHNYVAFVELALKARDSRYEWEATTVEACQRLVLVNEDRTIFTDVHKVIMAAAEGDELNFRLVLPFAEP